MRSNRNKISSLICFLCIVLVSVFILGCQGKSVKFEPIKLGHKQTKSSKLKNLKFYSDISWVSLVANTPLIDIENDGIADGVSVRLYLFRKGDPKPVAGDGTVILHLFQRVKMPDGKIYDKELHKWKLSREQLKRSVAIERFGLYCHYIELYWSDVKITAPDVYLRAEFIRGDNRRVFSRPVYLAITLRR